MTGLGSTRYLANLGELVHENVDGEVIIIHLSSGDYFSLTGSGPRIWELLGGGADIESLERQLALEYGDLPEDTSAVLDELLAQLATDSLVIEVPEGHACDANDEAPAAAASNGAYEPPKLEKFTDLSNYFLVDPIHDVSLEGWPKPSPEG